MYRKYYGLKADPFRLSPDHAFCLQHRSFAKAKAYMRYAMHRNEGFVMITGAPGTGKTTLIDDLLAGIRDSGFSIARLVSAQVEADDILRMVAAEFGLTVRQTEKSEILRLLFNQFTLNFKQGKRSLLIVDEAQHALTSEAGEATMSALKSARDQLNRPGEVNLMLVMSGSDRDKLLRLVNTNGSPFYGSQISRMPPLGQDFIDQVARLIAAQRPDLAPIDSVKLLQSFEHFGHRPQFFMEALGQALSPLSALQGMRFEQAVLQAAQQRQHAEEKQMESEYLALRPLEQALLWRLLDQGPRFRPYDGEALRFYRERVTDRVTPQMAQRALESLRERNPALVWKSARGEYAVDDAAMHRWFEQRVKDGRWPPADPQGQLAIGEE